MINFFIKGVPVPQGRPRFSVIKKRGGGQFVNTYDPPKSREWKGEIERQLLDGLWKGKPLEGALQVHLSFSMPRPKSLPKKTIHHVKKPDVDNLAKATLDAMTDICFKDDSQVVSLISEKFYTEHGSKCAIEGVGVFVAITKK